MGADLALDGLVVHHPGIHGGLSNVAVEVLIGAKQAVEAVDERVVPFGPVEEHLPVVLRLAAEGDEAVTAQGIGPGDLIDFDLLLGFNAELEVGDAVVADQGVIVLVFGLASGSLLDVHPLGPAAGVAVAGPQGVLFLVPLGHELDGLGSGPNLRIQCVAVVSLRVVLGSALKCQDVVAAAVAARFRGGPGLIAAAGILGLGGFALLGEQGSLLLGQEGGLFRGLGSIGGIGFEQGLRVHLEIALDVTLLHEGGKAAQSVAGVALGRLHLLGGLIGGLGRRPVFGVKGGIALADLVLVGPVQLGLSSIPVPGAVLLLGLGQVHDAGVGFGGAVHGVILLWHQVGRIEIEALGLGVVLLVEALIGPSDEPVVFLLACLRLTLCGQFCGSGSPVIRCRSRLFLLFSRHIFLGLGGRNLGQQLAGFGLVRLDLEGALQGGAGRIPRFPLQLNFAFPEQTLVFGVGCRRFLGLGLLLRCLLHHGLGTGITGNLIEGTLEPIDALLIPAPAKFDLGFAHVLLVSAVGPASTGIGRTSRIFRFLQRRVDAVLHPAGVVHVPIQLLLGLIERHLSDGLVEQGRVKPCRQLEQAHVHIEKEGALAEGLRDGGGVDFHIAHAQILVGEHQHIVSTVVQTDGVSAVG